MSSFFFYQNPEILFNFQRKFKVFSLKFRRGKQVYIGAKVDYKLVDYKTGWTSIGQTEFSRKLTSCGSEVRKRNIFKLSFAPEGWRE